MNRIHHYQGLESNRKSILTEPQSTKHQLNFGKSRSTFNNSISQSITFSIDKSKSIYLSDLQSYYEMHLMERLAGQIGLLPLQDKLLLLHQFEELHNSMIENLNNILTQILQINFEQEGFQNIYHTDPEYLSETLFRDLKYIEEKHSALVYESSLKYLSNLFDCMGLEQIIDIYQLNIHDWADKGLEHILKFRSLKRQFRQESKFQKYCKCLKQLIK